MRPLDDHPPTGTTCAPPPSDPPPPIDTPPRTADHDGRGADPADSPASDPAAGGDPGRAGAVWVTATGVCCVLAAAALFLAVRWDTLADEAKFGVLAALTATAILAGRGLTARLPATGGVLFHLGILLLPIDMVAATRPLERPWPEVALATATATALCWWAVGRTTRSAVLGWGAAIAVAVAAGAAGMVSGVPAPLLLATVALAAALRRSDRCAIGWAVLAGLAPLLGGLQAALEPAVDVLGALGADPSVPGTARLAIGVAAAAALALVAHHRRDLVLVTAAAAVVTVGVVGFVADVAPRPDAAGVLVTIGVALVVAELVAHVLRKDTFWSTPARWLAGTAELLSGFAAVVIAQGVYVLLLVEWFDPERSSALVASLGDAGTLLIAGVLNTFGWLLAEHLRSETPVRRRPDVRGWLREPGWAPATVAASVYGTATLVVLAPTLVAVAVLVVLTAALVASSRRGAVWCAAAVAVVIAALPTAGSVVELLAVGTATVAVAVAIAFAAQWQLTRDQSPLGAWPLALLVAVLAAVGVVRGATAFHPAGAVLDPDVAAVALGVLFVLWHALAALLDGDRPTQVTERLRPGLGLPGRLTTLVVACGSVLVFDAVAALWLVGVAVLVNVVDLLRTRDDLTPAMLVVLVALAGGLAPVALGYPLHMAAVGLALTAVVASGLGALGNEELRRWTDVLAVLAITPALFIATVDPAVFGAVLLAAATLAAMRAVLEQSTGWAAAAASLGVAGTWLELLAADVPAYDAYAAPLAAALLGAGVVARRGGTSSWVAYTPSVVLLGGAALVERFAGGGWVHAVVAGTVGVVAIAAGGWRLLAGPLLVGSAVLAALVIHESLAVTAGVPTWAWLALAGGSLIAAGIAMERTATTPFRAGQRVAEVLTTRFT
ncbi:MAG: hypothetical protein JJU45_19995 [Acidimicrobiia bacterium]|nr:hypothetical protein [Acidimicrobiia bacterium]MCC5954377.1 hypothetical protein [Acidimicrobiia bacterium]